MSKPEVRSSLLRFSRLNRDSRRGSRDSELQGGREWSGLLLLRALRGENHRRGPGVGNQRLGGFRRRTSKSRQLCLRSEKPLWEVLPPRPDRPGEENSTGSGATAMNECQSNDWGRGCWNRGFVVAWGLPILAMIVSASTGFGVSIDLADQFGMDGIGMLAQRAALREATLLLHRTLLSCDGTGGWTLWSRKHSNWVRMAGSTSATSPSSVAYCFAAFQS